MEIWKDIVWYEWLYQVSNLGNVKSLNYKRTKQEKLLKLVKHSNWYIQVCLSKNKKIFNQYVHILVWENFLYKDDNKKEINHKNWNKHDNTLENLEWVTKSENCLHKFRVLWYKNKKFYKIKWLWNKNSRKIIQYDKNLNKINVYSNITLASIKLWIEWANIIKVCNWKRKTAWWFIFKYY